MTRCSTASEGCEAFDSPDARVDLIPLLQELLDDAFNVHLHGRVQRIAGKYRFLILSI
jgi:hypothetical protein